jgi:hypothetical protein
VIREADKFHQQMITILHSQESWIKIAHLQSVLVVWTPNSNKIASLLLINLPMKSTVI